MLVDETCSFGFHDIIANSIQLTTKLSVELVVIGVVAFSSFLYGAT